MLLVNTHIFTGYLDSSRTVCHKQLKINTKHAYAIKPVPKPVPSAFQTIRSSQTQAECRNDTAATLLYLDFKRCLYFLQGRESYLLCGLLAGF